MNESSWGAPPGAGQWGPTDHGPASSLRGVAPPVPAGPVYDRGDAAQTRPMPLVPGPGGHQDDDREHRDIRENRDHLDDRGAARLSGPLFRDEKPQEPMPTSRSGSDSSPDSEKPKKKSAGRNLRAAIGVGIGLGVIIVASLFVYKPIFIGVIAIAVVVGLWELTSRLAERKDIKVPLVPLAVGGTAMVVAGYVRGAEGAWVAMALTALAVLVWRMTEAPENYLRDVTAGVFAAFYVPFLATFVALMLAAEADGALRVLTFLLLTVVSDTGAYAVGWRFGKHKLAPRISPGKTREGLVGAVLFAMVAGALCMEFLIAHGAWWQGLLLGLAVAASATLGDLGESMIKRDLGIKDMGTLLPGHGGIMDRLDSLLPTAPVVWLLFVIFVGAG
ncbi:phosphatidate cytidylyltransferase [Streptomyces sp. 2333.5]|uniref:phosphatidate cytidylyltransferase n=1 Tax=unclassified Streptomyces TaxID=2593676 RepID=UPI0008948572|nr:MULTISPECIES: phosphatidate cytidylyltransferase [unclassified Streptomyces]PJJ04769.1 phosphatidate cytidylyltransferase [Streptomyces sp. 2333.5]SEE87022.1 phosphatidate cytidylyltransferase [Streptomyces sp. 2112.2]SOE10860.1 phosphatidate cytidylyltransferase [Streptomyces sp. 2323.1]